MAVAFKFAIDSNVVAQAAGIRLYDLHTDVEAICRAHEAVAPLARRLGVAPPRPGLAGCAYVHASTIGCEVLITPDSAEPWAGPCISSPEQIDDLREPDDYLSAGIVPGRLALAAKLKRRCPDASEKIGHDLEGPVTTAALMMGQSFFMLPYDNPARAHRLLEFVTRSAINYIKIIRTHQHRPVSGSWQSMPDDFAGMFGPAQFAEFVVPYWNMLFEGLAAEQRGVHSELLRPEHMRFLADVKLDVYDPGVNQYLIPKAVRRHCPVPYQLRLWPAQVRDHSAAELVEMYRHLASFEPVSIEFGLFDLAEEAKIAALLEVARELAQ